MGYAFAIGLSIDVGYKRVRENVATANAPGVLVAYAFEFQENGGAGRDRTDDLKLAKLPLSQLSYSPLLTQLRSTG